MKILKLVIFFMKLVPFFGLYKEYCANHHNATVKYQEREKDQKFITLIQKVKQETTCGLDLPSLLIMPIQRIPRYRLLFEELIKNTEDDNPDYPALKSCLDKIVVIADNVNESVREAENQEKLLQIQNLS